MRSRAVEVGPNVSERRSRRRVPRTTRSRSRARHEAVAVELHAGRADALVGPERRSARPSRRRRERSAVDRPGLDGDLDADATRARRVPLPETTVTRRRRRPGWRRHADRHRDADGRGVPVVHPRVVRNGEGERSGGLGARCAATTRAAVTSAGALFVVMSPKRSARSCRTASAALCHQNITKSAFCGTCGYAFQSAST